MKLLILPLIFMTLGVSVEEDSEVVRIRYEKQIAESLRSVLRSVISDYLFTVSASIRIELKMVTTPVAKAERKSEKKSSVPPTSLPGFDLNPIIDEPESTLIVKEDFNYVSQARFKRVAVFIVFDPRVGEKSRNVALAMTEQRLNATFGNVATLSHDIADLSQLQAEKELNEWLDILKENLALIILLTVITILLIVLIYVLKKKLEKKALSGDLKAEGDEKDKSEEEDSEAKEQAEDYGNMTVHSELRKFFNTFFTQYIKDTYLTSAFVKELNGDFREIVRASVLQSPLSDYFVEALEFDPDEFTPDHDSISISTIHKLSTYFDDYMTGHKKLISRPFGYIQYLSVETVRECVDGTPDEIAVCIKYLTEEKASELLNYYSSEVKAEILKNLQDDNFFRKAQVLVSRLDEKLRKKYQDTKGRPVFGKKHQEEVVDLLVNHDPNIADTIKLYKAMTDGVLPGRFKGYDVSFDDLKEQYRDMLKEILVNAENEIIVNSMEGFRNDADFEMIKAFTGMRREIINNLLRHYEYNEESTKKAQREILAIFRERLRLSA